MKNDIVTQTKSAFEFIEKLYLETSYLIKEIEGLLNDEKERFVIGKPSGYHVSVKSSSGLETNNVKSWLYKKFGVFFVPEEKTKTVGGQTVTLIRNDLKLIYLRIALNDLKEIEPSIYSGVIFDIWSKKSEKVNKFEHLMGSIQQKDDKIFLNTENLDYEDPSIKLKGQFIKNNLYNMNNSQSLVDNIINPALDLYRNLNP